MLLLAALAEPAAAQTGVLSPATSGPVCQAGILRCARPKDEYGMCKRNDLLDFFMPGLPPAGDRSKAESTADANKVTWVDKTHAKLQENAQLQRLDALLRSDFLTYDTETTDYVATGHVRYQDAGMLMAADKGHGTTTPSVTLLDDARYQMLDQRGNGIAKTVNQTDPDHSKMIQGTFSTCDPSERMWEMRADTLEIDKVKNEGYGHGVTFAYEGVPFLWLPYMSFPLDDERQSGFLMPTIGYSSRRGFKVGIPYYFDLAPNYDATLKPVEYTKRGTFLDGQFRYLSTWDQLQVDFGYLPHDEETGQDSRGYLRLRDWASFSPTWSAIVDVHHVSDTEYLRDFGDSFQSTAISLLPSSAYVNGNGGWWNASIGGDLWEVTDPSIQSFCAGGGPLQGCTNPVVYKPYTRLPRATFNIDKIINGFEFGFGSEYVNFQRGYSLTGQRLDLYPHVSYPIEEPGWFLRPDLGFRVTHYDLSNLFYATPAERASATATRSMPIFSLDSGLFFERDTKLFDNAFIQTLEPRLFYLYVPYRNQDSLPNFDTSVPSYDLPSLFRTNAFTGGDRQSNANNITVALTTRLIDADSGDQLLSASAGQIRYLSRARVTLPYYPDPNISGKDVFAHLDLRLGKDWDLTWDQQWNPHPKTPVGTDPITGDTIYDPTNRHTDLSSISIQHRFGTDGVVNFAYRFRRDTLEQYDATTLIPLNQRWSIIGRYYYSLRDNRKLETFGGVQYDSCCVAARLVVRRFLNNVSNIGNGADYIPNDVKPETMYFFEIEFKGIGASGTRTENFLRHAILGYNQ